MEWISVKDRLPQHGEEVLIIDNEMNYHMSYFNADTTISCYCWDCDEYGLRKEDVDYWMPLPKPPNN
jgi:hypothetical protein